MRPRADPRTVGLFVIAFILLCTGVYMGWVLFHQEDRGEPDIRVEEVYFVMEEMKGNTSRIKIIIFVTNTGDGGISELGIRAFAVEKGSNLAKDDSTIHLHDINKTSTVEGNLFVEVPNRDRYRIELLIFQEGKLELRGSGSINLDEIGTATDYRTYGADDEGQEPAFSGAGLDSDSLSVFILCWLFIGASIVGVIVMIIVISKRKKTEIGPRISEEGPVNERNKTERSVPYEPDEAEQKEREAKPLSMGPKDEPDRDEER